MQDSCHIISKIESSVAYATPDIPSKFQKNPFITFWVIVLTQKQTNKNRQKHNLLGGGNHRPNTENIITSTTARNNMSSSVCKCLWPILYTF